MNLYIQDCSDSEYEEMVVDICDKNGRIAMLSSDEGIGHAKIHLIDPKTDKISYEIDLSEVSAILDKAFERLKEINP